MLRKEWTQVEVPVGWTHLIRGPRPKSEQWARAVCNQSAAVGREPQPGVQPCPTRPLAATWSESSESRGLDRCCQEEGPFSRSCTRSSRRGRRHGIARGKDVAEVFGSSEASRSGTSRWGAVDASEKFVERARKRLAQHDERVWCQLQTCRRRGPVGETLSLRVERSTYSASITRFTGRDSQVEGNGCHNGG